MPPTTNDTALAKILTKEIVDCPATRRYQQALDMSVDQMRESWDFPRGFRGSAEIALPHETVDGYWELPAEERERLTTPEAVQAYRSNAGRGGTARLSLAAFCWHSPLSRYHGDGELLQFFSNGLRSYVDSIRADGLMGLFGLNGESWAHGWDIEGLIYGLTICRDHLDPDLVERALDGFRRAAVRLTRIPREPTSFGSYGNQRVVWTLGLELYGQILGEPKLRGLSNTFFYEALDKILDASGQVIEQQGPCLHYSYTAFIYAWLNLAVRGDTRYLERVENCLRWFYLRHTESFWPLAGPSARSFVEVLPGTVADLLPAAEQIAASNPAPRQWALAALESLFERTDLGWDKYAAPLGHGAPGLMWAMLMCPGPVEPSAEQSREWTAPTTTYFHHTHLLKRFPMKYILVRRRYQTHFNCRDYLPFSGIQTWALDNEPPVIHPTPLAPSTTQGYALDTARQGVSHNWGGYGAGAVGVDGYINDPEADDELRHLVARYDWFWRIVVFTDVSTMVLEFGKGGPRRRLWTLNRLEPRQPQIGNGVVTFDGLEACLHSSVKAPTLVELDVDHKWAEDVRQLVYDCGEGPAVFALSDASFKLPADSWFDDGVVRFADSAGEYETVLHPGFLQAPNAGNLEIDTFKLAHDTTTRKL